MVAVRNCNVATIRSVLMLVLGVLHAAINGALVPMILMLMMQMTIMHVVHVIFMRNGNMAAIGSMNMWMFVLHDRILHEGIMA
jgi:hypothetical protein